MAKTTKEIWHEQYRSTKEDEKIIWYASFEVEKIKQELLKEVFDGNIRFTKKQIEYLASNLRWLNDAKVDRWIAYLPELREESFGVK